MPAPVIPLAPLVVVSKRAAFHAAENLSSASFAGLLVRLAWQRLPDWIKTDLLLQFDANEDMKLQSLAEKLQTMIAKGAQKVEPVPHLHAALLLYWQLSAQLSSPSARDVWYEQSGKLYTELLDKDLKEYLRWSCLAYERDRTSLEGQLEDDWIVLQHEFTTRPGHVGHILLISHKQKKMVIACKGTSSFEDFLTDCCAQAVDFGGDMGGDARIEIQAAELHHIHVEHEEAVEVSIGHEQILVDENIHSVRCHEGIMASAKRLARTVHATVHKWVVIKGYHFVACGHSLGAGAACLLALVLRSLLPIEDRIRVVAFAPPPILDHDSSIAASSYITSIVNNADAIPRASLANVAVLVEFLRAVSARLQEQGLAPTNPKSTAALIQKLAKGKDDKALLMTPKEVQVAMERAHVRVQLRDPDHLYVPGKVYILHHSNHPWNKQGDESFDCFASGKARVFQADGTSPVLRLFEFDSLRLLSDHLLASYEQSMSDLCL